MQADYTQLYILLSAVLIVCVDSFSNNNLATNQKHLIIANHKQQHIIRQSTFTHFASTDDTIYTYNNTTTQNRLIVFGLGNVGSLVAERGSSLHQVDKGVPFFEHVYGTTRTTKDIVDGVQSIGFEDYQELKKILPSCTHVLVTIPPLNPSTDINSDNQQYCDPVLNHSNYSIKDILPANTWIGYISSTSVYGNHDGEWVTEESETKCEVGTRAEVYLKAENEWRTATKECDWKLHIFRCAGLYSNNRSALHTILKNGPTADKTEASTTKIGSPTSRIHEEDVCRAVLSAMNYNKSISGGTNLWNLADDEPEVRSKVMAYGAQLLEGANLLPFFAESSSTQTVMNTKTTTKPKQSERSSRRLIDRKRVDAQRMKDLLLPDGKLYPTYREGLTSILDSNRIKWLSDS